MRKYVLGFVFNDDLTKVLLIKKLRPSWQAGKHNGIGGKIEDGETPYEAMIREAKEESNIDTEYWSWLHVGDMSGIDWKVIIYVTRHQGEEYDAESLTDEEIGWFDIKDLPNEALYNLDWLVPLALDKIKSRSLLSIDIKYDI